MPYVPSADRPELDAKIGVLAKALVDRVSSNYETGEVYVKAFKDVIEGVHGATGNEANALGAQIWGVAVKYNYEGAYLGELNYSMTRLIQELPQAMVDAGKWKEALRYWLYAITVGALIKMAVDPDLTIGEQGVFEDIKDEYKRRVNPAYEAVQVVKSGDCYTTPYHTVVVKAEGTDAVTGETVKGYQEIMVDFRPGQKAY